MLACNDDEQMIMENPGRRSW